MKCSEEYLFSVRDRGHVRQRGKGHSNVSFLVRLDKRSELLDWATRLLFQRQHQLWISRTFTPSLCIYDFLMSGVDYNLCSVSRPSSYLF
jgi:hypothetical protein